MHLTSIQSHWAHLSKLLLDRGRFEHNVKEGGGVTKQASSFIYIIPSTYTGEIFGFINFEQLNPMGIMANTNLTNQRQMFVEEYVLSNKHLESIRKV